jgi:hypothetical protein
LKLETLFVVRELPYILESNPHSVFGDFLNGKKLVCDSDLHFSFICPLPTGRLILNKRAQSRPSTDNDSVVSDDGESDWIINYNK